jgi:LPS-assembly lipoprotein
MFSCSFNEMVCAMKKLTSLFCVPLLCIGLSGLTACGFHLRGTQSAAISADYQHLQLVMPDIADPLREPLSVYLQSLGANLDNNKQSPILRITEYDAKRQLLSGRLTEVQLILKVTFHIEDSAGQPITAERTIFARRNYQYDIATVNTDNQEEVQLIANMNQDAAQQIARQLHAGRLQYVGKQPLSTIAKQQ